MDDLMIHKYEYYKCKKYIRKHARDIYVLYMPKRVTGWSGVLRDAPQVKVYSIVCMYLSRVFLYNFYSYTCRGIKI
jgi:hypothetical protein